MKKVTALCSALLLVLAVNVSRAQDDKKLSFGFNVGTTIPVGGFGKTDSTALPVSRIYNKQDTTKYNGFAGIGFHFNVFASYMFTKNIGAIVSVGGNICSYNEVKLNETAEEDIVANTSYTGAAINYTASGGYYIGQYLIGPIISLPATDLLNIEFKVQVGLVTANYPTLSYTGYFYNPSTFSNQSYEVSQSVASASGFGYNLSVGAKLNLGNIGVHFTIGYTGSSISYPNYTNAITSGTSSETDTYNVPKSMSLGMIQIATGISFSI